MRKGRRRRTTEEEDERKQMIERLSQHTEGGRGGNKKEGKEKGEGGGLLCFQRRGDSGPRAHVASVVRGGGGDGGTEWGKRMEKQGRRQREHSVTLTVGAGWGRRCLSRNRRHAHTPHTTRNLDRRLVPPSTIPSFPQYNPPTQPPPPPHPPFHTHAHSTHTSRLTSTTTTSHLPCLSLSLPPTLLSREGACISPLCLFSNSQTPSQYKGKISSSSSPCFWGGRGLLLHSHSSSHKNGFLCFTLVFFSAWASSV